MYKGTEACVWGGWWQQGEESRCQTDRGKQSHHLPVLALVPPSPPLHQLLALLLGHQYAAGLARSTTRPRPLNTLPLLWGERLEGSAPRNPVDNLGFLLPADEWKEWEKEKTNKETHSNEGIMSVQTPIQRSADLLIPSCFHLISVKL